MLQYAGQSGERAGMRKKIAAHDLIVMSYETLRSDHAQLADQGWCYCVLDEGHVIKNAKTKLSQVHARSHDIPHFNQTRRKGLGS